MEKPIRGDNMVKEEKGVPKRDGSGKGTRENQGRGGCTTTEQRKKQIDGLLNSRKDARKEE